MADDLDSRVAVLDSRLDDHLAQPDGHSSTAMLRGEINILRVQLAVIETKVAMYAAIGALLGGAIADVAFNLLEGFLKR